jgi:FAD/FMN-containing dehydrogenase
VSSTSYLRTSDVNAIAELRSRMTGPVITPDDVDYESARRVFYSSFERRPVAIARVANATDVSLALSLARTTGLELAVRGGGHSVAGHSTAEGGLVIDLSGLRSVHIDARKRAAWADAGVTAADYTTAAAEHGLATGFGDTGSVGVSGITLAGGIGLLVRKHGLSIDNLLAAEVVTADGQVLYVDPDSHPDLFWAIRGGGGNFGVATRFQFRLQEVNAVMGGLLMLPATPAAIRGFIAAAESAPEELSTIANVLTAPPAPFIPAEYHGRPIVVGFMVHSSGGDAAERAFAPFRALASPIADMIRPMPYADIYKVAEAPAPAAITTHSMFVDEVDESSAEVILEHLRTSSAPIRAAQLRVLGGAMARVASDATAFAHRQQRVYVNLAAGYERVEDAGVHEAWLSKFAAALPHVKPGAYTGFMGNEGETRVREAYPGPTWDRLVDIKSRYDPDNLFRLNQNVPPRSAALGD